MRVIMSVTTMVKGWVVSSVLAASLMAAAANAQVKVNVNVKDGATISGALNLRATVESKALVSSVEFYVGDELRVSDDSTPYECPIDTISEKEGDLKIKVAAYNSDGQSATVTLNLKVDNGVSKGAQWHVDQGRDFLTKAKWDEAINSGRVALKCDPKFLPAKLLLAHGNFNKGVFDAAQKYIQDVLDAEPNNLEALDLRAGIDLERAFNTRDADRKTALAQIKKALFDAATSRAKINEARMDGFGPVNDENRLRFADACLQTGAYEKLINTLDTPFNNDPKNSSIANRYIYGLMRAGRMRKAIDTLTVVYRRGSPDGITHALNAIALQYLGKDQESLDAEKAALLNDASDVSIRSAQVYLAMMRGKTGPMFQLATDLARSESGRWEPLHFLSIAANAKGEYEISRENSEEAILHEPTAHDAYVARANQLISLSLNSTADKDLAQYYRDLARAFLEGALQARRESFEALCGVALLDLTEGKLESGIRYADAASRSGKEYGVAPYLLVYGYSAQSTAYTRAAQDAATKSKEARDRGLTAEAQKLMKQAGDLQAQARAFDEARERAVRACAVCDPFNLEGVGTPTLLQVWKYFASKGRTPLIIPPQY